MSVAASALAFDWDTGKFRGEGPIDFTPDDGSAEPQQFWTDFTEYTVGSEPSDWRQLWEAGDWRVVDEPNLPHGRALRHVTGTVSARYGLTWNKVDKSALTNNVEIVFQWRSTSPSSALGLVRASGATPAEAVGYAGGGTGDSQVTLTNYATGSAKNSNVFFLQSVGQWYRTRVRARGVTVYMRTWLATDPEPGTWNVVLENTRDEKGRVGLFTYTGASSGTVNRDFAWIGVGVGGLDAPIKASAPPAETETGGSTPTSPTTSTITVRDVVWTFSEPLPHGRFINGDYWVTPVSGNTSITLTSVTPDPDFTVDAESNGMMLNPSTSTHGYDGKRGYRAEHNVAAMPLTVPANSTLVKAMDRIPGYSYSQGPDIEDAVVLTVLDAPPADGANGANTFRPAYYGPWSEKRFFTWADVDTTKIPSHVPPPEGPGGTTLAEIEKKFRHTQLDQRSNWQGRYLHPVRAFRNYSDETQVENYGSEVARDNITALTRLCLNDSLADKKPALIQVLQACIDYYGYYRGGGTLPADGGHGIGRKIMAVFGGVVFNNLEWQEFVKATEWPEDRHIRRSSKTNMVLYGRAFGSSSFDNWRLNRSGSKDIADPLELVDGGTPGSLYQKCCTAMAYTGSAIVAHLLGAKGKELLGANALEYADRWMEFGAWVYDRDMDGVRLNRTWKKSDGSTVNGEDTYHGVSAGTGSYSSSLAQNMWDAYRTSSFGPLNWVRRAGA